MCGWVQSTGWSKNSVVLGFLISFPEEEMTALQVKFDYPVSVVKVLIVSVMFLQRRVTSEF